MFQDAWHNNYIKQQDTMLNSRSLPATARVQAAIIFVNHP